MSQKIQNLLVKLDPNRLENRLFCRTCFIQLFVLLLFLFAIVYILYVYILMQKKYYTSKNCLNSRQYHLEMCLLNNYI